MIICVSVLFVFLYGLFFFFLFFQIAIMLVIICFYVSIHCFQLAYDYKFDFEDDQHKIPCLCGAPNCRKWMN